MTDVLGHIDQVLTEASGRRCVVCEDALSAGWPFDWCPSDGCRASWAAAVRRRVAALSGTPDPAPAPTSGRPNPPAGYAWAPGDIPGWDAVPQHLGGGPCSCMAEPVDARLARWDAAAHQQIAEASAEELVDALRDSGRIGYLGRWACEPDPPRTLSWWQRVPDWLGYWMPGRRR